MGTSTMKVRDADDAGRIRLNVWTIDSLALAREMIARNCVAQCSYVAFVSRVRKRHGIGLVP